MKKIISLILTLAMVFSMTAMTASAGFWDTTNSKNKDAINKLQSMGVIEGKGNNYFDPASKLTRAEACAIVVRAMLAEKNIYPDPNKIFEDVESTNKNDAWIENSIESAYRENFIHGYGNGKFGPFDYLTYAQFMTIVLNMLGYDMAHLDGNWPENVMIQSHKMGLDVNTGSYSYNYYYPLTPYEANDMILREDVAQIIYNALNESLVKWDGRTFVRTDKTLEKYFNEIHKINAPVLPEVMEEFTIIDIKRADYVNSANYHPIISLTLRDKNYHTFVLSTENFGIDYNCTDNNNNRFIEIGATVNLIFNNNLLVHVDFVNGVYVQNGNDIYGYVREVSRSEDHIITGLKIDLLYDNTPDAFAYPMNGSFNKETDLENPQGLKLKNNLIHAVLNERGEIIFVEVLGSMPR